MGGMFIVLCGGDRGTDFNLQLMMVKNHLGTDVWLFCAREGKGRHYKRQFLIPGVGVQHLRKMDLGELPGSNTFVLSPLSISSREPCSREESAR